MAGTTAALRLETASILLLEDVGEAEFRLERSFQQLIGSIERDRLRAVCLGGFNNCDLAEGTRSLTAIFAERAADVPLYAGLPMSHGHENSAWRYGNWTSIDASKLGLKAPPRAR